MFLIIFRSENKDFKSPGTTWTVAELSLGSNDIGIVESKIMRKIYGPTRTEDGHWRIKTNLEINDRLKGQNKIGFIKNKG
jgi:hypothetical protein